MTNILGISCFYHDAAAALIQDGAIVAAAEEERFTRKKHDSGFPEQAIRFCLEQAGITSQDLDMVIFYDKPLLKFERILMNTLEWWPWNLRQFIAAIPPWLKEKLWVPYIIRTNLDYHGPIYFTEHHLAHAASAFFPSPFDEAAIVTVDGVGEWATASLGIGQGNKITIEREIHWPHSLGMLYSAITGYLGFKVNSAEYKVMGAAPYGKPVYKDKLQKLITWKEDGSFRLNLEYFAYPWGLQMFSRRLEKLLGFPPRKPESELEQHHYDLAASLQELTNEIMVAIARFWVDEVGIKKLCLAGGVAYNCVANVKIVEAIPDLEGIFIQPAAGDSGGAIGAALAGWHMILNSGSRVPMTHAYFGSEFSDVEIEAFLNTKQIPDKKLTKQELINETVQAIMNQKIVGWFQGRMEFGPRALGNRSILGDPRNPEMKNIINEKIKLREPFRPFAPSVLLEEVSEWFTHKGEAPYMILNTMVRQEKRHLIPAVTHVDGSARIQTVSYKTNPLYHELIKTFQNRTAVPVLLNTSFNIRGEPIVRTPEEAFRTFMRTDMDVLILGSFLLEKEKMPAWEEDAGWKSIIESD